MKRSEFIAKAEKLLGKRVKIGYMRSKVWTDDIMPIEGHCYVVYGTLGRFDTSNYPKTYVPFALHNIIRLDENHDMPIDHVSAIAWIKEVDEDFDYDSLRWEDDEDVTDGAWADAREFRQATI